MPTEPRVIRDAKRPARARRSSIESTTAGRGISNTRRSRFDSHRRRCAVCRDGAALTGIVVKGLFVAPPNNLCASKSTEVRRARLSLSKFHQNGMATLPDTLVTRLVGSDSPVRGSRSRSSRIGRAMAAAIAVTANPSTADSIVWPRPTSFGPHRDALPLAPICRGPAAKGNQLRLRRHVNRPFHESDIARLSRRSASCCPRLRASRIIAGSFLELHSKDAHPFGAISHAAFRRGGVDASLSARSMHPLS